MENLKNYQPHIFAFIIINLLIIGIDNFLSIDIKNIDKPAIVRIVSMPSIAVLSAYVVNGLLTSEMKFRIVFFKWKNPLPASRLLKVIKKDSRFEIEQVIEKFGEIPIDPIKQNAYWYQKIYKINQDKEKIRDAHRNFLMTRDLTAICLIFFIASIINVILFSGSINQILIIFIEFFLLRYVASNYGHRLVTTSVAEAV
ncbi:hypothetical protein ACFSCX_02405 [Bacillus salitolerans]|uniref:Uncharacterized protein n=1 Tax=Bacillus salitolerans TaxID=1437434 RepID=A0ABW4LJX1_9BACI